jgi:hypothetical protein
MSYRRIEGDGLRTTYAYAPRFTVAVTRDGPTNVRLEFASSSVYLDNEEFRVTIVSCEHVVEYDWNDFEFHRHPGNFKDAELGLIEITDSSLIAEIMSTGRYVRGPLHHLRVGFDDHGTYDIVCERFTINYARSTDHDLYP